MCSILRVQQEYDNETIIYDYNCSTLTHYTQGICLDPLKEVLAAHNCKPNPDGSIQVVVNGEKRAKQLIQTLNIITAKPSCKEVVVPFLCLYFNGLCSEVDTILYITSDDCKRIRDVDCVKEWELAVNFAKVKGEKLPSCDDFPPIAMTCKDQPRRKRKKSGNLTLHYGLQHKQVYSKHFLVCILNDK